MAKSKLNLSLNNVITCAMYAVIGLLLLILKAGSLGILMTIIGVLLIVGGVVDILGGKDLVKGLVQIAIGVIVIVLGWLIADLVLLIFGILLIVKGAVDLYNNFKAGFAAMLSPIVTVVIGILLVVSKWALLDLICIIAGIVFIVDGVLALFGKSLKK